jgi:hypothetical protein
VWIGSGFRRQGKPRGAVGVPELHGRGGLSSYHQPLSPATKTRIGLPACMCPTRCWSAVIIHHCNCPVLHTSAPQHLSTKHLWHAPPLPLGLIPSIRPSDTRLSVTALFLYEAGRRRQVGRSHFLIPISLHLRHTSGRTCLVSLSVSAACPPFFSTSFTLYTFTSPYLTYPHFYSLSLTQPSPPPSPEGTRPPITHRACEHTPLHRYLT